MKVKLLIAVVGLQAGWIIATVLAQETILARGATVVLETAPVDPRDLLRGDYVILSYKISTLPAALFPEGLLNDVAPGTPVFVRLEKRGQFHEAESASFSAPEPDAAHPVLRGTVSGPSFARGDTGAVRVEYGLERFYVREGTGQPHGTLTVEAAVTPSGDAIIRQVFIDGRPYADVMRTQTR